MLKANFSNRHECSYPINIPKNLIRFPTRLPTDLLGLDTRIKFERLNTVQSLMSEPILQRFCRAFGNNVFRGISRVMKSRSIYTNVTETDWAEVIRGTGSSTQIAGQKETPSIRLSPEAAWAQHSTNFLRLAKPPQTSYSGLTTGCFSYTLN